MISGAIGYLRTTLRSNSFWEGFAAACALFGCAWGRAGRFLSDRFGRKKVLVPGGTGLFRLALGTAVPRTLTTFIIFRFLGGLGIGAASITSPMYIAEITPFRIRGRMVSLNQFAIVSGILIVYFVNYFIVSHGLAVDRKTIQVQEATGGKYLDATKVRKYLEDRVGEMVNRQIEQFLVQPAEARSPGGWSSSPLAGPGCRAAGDRRRRRAAKAGAACGKSWRKSCPRRTASASMSSSPAST